MTATTQECCEHIEQVLEAAPHKAAAVQPLTTHNDQVRRTRHAGHCRRNRDELLWTLHMNEQRSGRPVRAYVRQLCADSECSPEDLPEAMDDRERWREMVRDIHADGAT